MISNEISGEKVFQSFGHFTEKQVTDYGESQFSRELFLQC